MSGHNALADPASGFSFVAGGTIPTDSDAYVPRRADAELLRCLLLGEFCYVLDSRQTGKSSLGTRTAAHLRDLGVVAPYIDLTGVGHSVEREQWYYTLLMILAVPTEMQSELRACWADRADLPPLARWIEGLRLILRARPQKKIILFIDEIDTVLALPFKAAEFFAGIRSCYNRRSQEPEFARLTFCLLGVANPSDLISDTRLTPFNIGRRIELNDFTEDEARPLERGLGDEEIVRRAVLDRVLYWTGGHPYLTQRLCQAVTESGEVVSPGLVDTLCESLFLSPRAREQDDNLVFVRDRLVMAGAYRPTGQTDETHDKELAELLDLYRQVLIGRRVKDDSALRMVAQLRLSGAVRGRDGILQVRNRIYERVFDRAWIATHMPGSEVRRMRAAARRAWLQAGSITAAMTLLAAGAIVQTRSARLSEAHARRAELTASALAGERDRASKAASSQAYLATMQLIQRQFESGDYARVVELLETIRNSEFRGIEWDYWNRLMNLQKLNLKLDGSVLRVVFSRDGRKLMTLTNQGNTTIWDPATGRELASLKDDQHAVSCGVFSPDGTRIAVGGNDRIAWVRDAKSMDTLRALSGHTANVWDIDWSSDGKTIVTAGLEGTVKTWDAPTGRALRSVEIGPGKVFAVALSPDGKHFLATDLLNATVWETATGRRVWTLKGHTSGVFAVKYSPDGKYIATGSDDRTARVWDAATGKQLAVLRGHAQQVMGVAFSPDSKLLATASRDMTARTWDWRTRRTIAVHKGHTKFLYSFDFSRDGRSLATSSEDSHAMVWDAYPRDSVAFLAHKGGARSAAFSPDGSKIVTAGMDGTARIWDASTGSMLACMKGHRGPVRNARFSPDGQSVVTAGVDGTARQWDAATGSELSMMVEGETGRLNSAEYSRDGQRIVTASEDGTARLWQRSGGAVKALSVNTERVFCASFSPDGKRFVTGGADSAARIWDVETSREILALRGHAVGVVSACFSADGRNILTASDDRTARLWDVETGRQIRIFKGHTDGVNRAAFSPDGMRILTSSWDGTARLWNRETGAELLSLNGSSIGMSSAAFSPDGRRVVTSSADGTARIWFLGPDRFNWDALARGR